MAGVRDMELEFEFDHLLLTIGSETNFFDLQGVRDWAVTMKSLSDAALLRNRMVALLEEASLEKDEATRRELLTFVTAGGGFAGVETTGAVNDFVRETVKFYPALREETVQWWWCIRASFFYLNWARSWDATPKKIVSTQGRNNQRRACRGV